MCADNQFNSVSSLFFSTPEKSVQTLFHDPYLTYNPIVLLIYCPIYFIIALLTYGLSVSSGLFIPGLLIGAAWGRIFGTCLHYANPILFPVPGKFALIGAAAQLGGIVRMTVSLTVILMEATGSVLVGLPILITLVVAKYTGDYFTEGIYDTHIGLSGMALLNWEPDQLAVTKRALDVMSCPVVYLDSVMRVGLLLERIGENCPHHGFPVVEGHVRPDRFQYGTLVGMITAEHLALLLKHKVPIQSKLTNYCLRDIQTQWAWIFLAEDGTQPCTLNIKDYDEHYPNFPKLVDEAQNVSREDRHLLIDLRPYMNEAPFRVPEVSLKAYGCHFS
ncbi:H(+)/Cl(-) exchange transporter 7 [Cichlidogyrus casuarinus]|uniref:H(+)/Cl(-) exchange transporter 7 n=1 Tax=Cichlidogyrus casuarinus TaxID=1844966 RepID=A0ABD2PL06_9PLAT